MRRILSPLALLTALALPMAAHADTVDDFSLFTSLDQNVTFSLPSSPTPEDTSALGFLVPNVLLDFNNTDTDGQIYFFTTLGGGGFNLTYDYPGGPGHIIVHGFPLFDGQPTSPTFIPGTYFLAGMDSLAILSITPETSSIPEPSTLLLLTTGALGILRRVRPLRIRKSP